VTILAALNAFYQEHRRCGELDGGVESDRVWMTCSYGAAINSNLSWEGNCRERLRAWTAQSRHRVYPTP